MSTRKEVIIDLFNSSFDLKEYIKFVEILFRGNMKFKSNLVFSPKIKREFYNVIESFLDLGTYRDKNKKTLALVVVKLKKEDSIARSRTIQRNFIKDYFLKYGTDSALVVFYNEVSEDWRLSFIKLDYSYNNLKLEENITPAKRFSFLLGKNEKHHTAVDRFLSLVKEDSELFSIEALEEIFNIEIVTKEFFEKYCDLYLRIKNDLDKQDGFLKVANEAQIRSDEFSKKLMGQLVFLYFLQKKGWLGVEANPPQITVQEANYLLSNKSYVQVKAFEKVYLIEGNKYIRQDELIKQLDLEEVHCLNNIFINTIYDAAWGTGDKNFIRSMFTKANIEGKNFFKDFLEPIFYNALNDKRGGETYFKYLNCKIPFLNGGLFQPISDNYDFSIDSFTISNDLFSNTKKTKQGDIGDGVLDIFDRYAFTIKEDEPLEKEVAVDPEMLGKVFENLLDITDRKKKGAFYTPREIVHYMCQESLINYLKNEITISYEDVETFIRYGDILTDLDSSNDATRCNNFKMPKIIRENSEKIDKALENVKIADPAVGSGAFPLGMVNEIVRARLNLTYYIESNQSILYKDVKLKGRTAYELKLKTIQRCIHAVDIERSAVDITKLRLWLSLVVEENDFRNIKSLPNLDYNIMVGNSLIEEFEGVKLFNDEILTVKTDTSKKQERLEQLSLLTGIQKSENLLEVIYQIEKRLKGTTDKIEKYNLEKELEEAKKTYTETAASIDLRKESEYILEEIYRLQENFFDANSKDEKISLKNRIDNLEWLLIEKTVKENNSEDLLIKIQELKRTNTKPYFLWKLNFAKVFREKNGFDIVIGNPPYGVKIELKQKKILKEQYPNVPDYEIAYYFIYKLMELISSSGYLAYIIPNTILSNLFAKKMRLDLLEKYFLVGVDNLSDIDVFESAKVRTCILKLSNQKSATSKFRIPKIKNHVYYISKEKVILRKILKDNIDNWLNIAYKSQIEMDIIDNIKRNTEALGAIASISQGLIPYDKYRGHSEETIKNKVWNATYKKDETFKRELKGKDLNRYRVSWNAKTWISYGEWLAAPRKKEFFNDKRILIREITNPRIFASICEEEFYNTPSIINIIDVKEYDYKYLLGIINSKMMTYYHLATSPKANKGLFPKILVNDVRNIPIKRASNCNYQKLVALVDLRLTTNDEILIDKLENEIDDLVCNIYELTIEQTTIINKKINND